MEKQLRAFEEKLQEARLSDLLDSLVLYSKAMESDPLAYEAVKLIKATILSRFGE